MNDKSYTDWYANSDKALKEAIGYFINHHRTQQQLIQTEVAEKANISRSTLSLLERGETVILSTLLRVLNLLHVMDVFKVTKTISPMALAKAEHAERQRVRSTNKPDIKKQ